MIEKVVVRFKKHNSVWSSGVLYNNLIDAPDGKIIFSRRYARGTSEKKIWEDIKSAVVGWFVEAFHLGAVQVTRPPKYFTGDPNQDLFNQSKHIQKQVFEKPDRYTYDTKWHITREGYIKGLEDAGVNINMGLGNEQFMYTDEDTSVDYLKKLQKMFHGKTITIILFVYPDRYDEEIRAMFTLEITFYPE